MLKEDIEFGKECLGTIKFVNLNYWLEKKNTHAKYALAWVVDSLWWTGSCWWEVGHANLMMGTMIDGLRWGRIKSWKLFENFLDYVAYLFGLMRSGALILELINGSVDELQPLLRLRCWFSLHESSWWEVGHVASVNYQWSID